MKPDARTDDPTHALDDFVRRMRSTAAPHEVAPDLSGLAALLHPAPAAAATPAGTPPEPPPPARGGVLRSGQRWAADAVQDVPVLILPTVAADAPPDGNEGRSATQAASRLAASQFHAEAMDARLPTWQPDPGTLQLRPKQHPRVLAQWQPGAWTGAVRQVLQGSTELITTAQGPVVETHAPQHLLLLWPPQRVDAPLLGRWPGQVRLWASDGGQPDAAAAEALLATLPADARLWLQPDAGAVDWALAAEILLTHDEGLRPHQAEGLRAFIGAEREASFARLNSAYHRPEAGEAVQRVQPARAV